jgi:histidyl-tRNA synthetase
LAEAAAPAIAETLRDAGLSVVLHAGGGSFKSQMKKADKSAACYALILGDDECQANLIAVKPMFGEGEQVKVTIQEAIKLIKVSN